MKINRSFYIETIDITEIKNNDGDYLITIEDDLPAGDYNSILLTEAEVLMFIKELQDAIKNEVVVDVNKNSK